jgi:16S rRNA (cytidine1402-2'-O)-methyltransferase
MPDGTLQTAAKLQHWICENAKSTRAYLKRIHAIHPLCVPLQAIHLHQLPHAIHKKGDHLGHFDARPLLQSALLGARRGAGQRSRNARYRRSRLFGGACRA